MSKNTKTEKSKVKAGVWFVSVRGSYLPASPTGWWTYLPFIAYLVFAFVAGVQYSSSVGMAILFIVPNWIAATTVITYVAAKKH